jgi:hypothetical protein
MRSASVSAACGAVLVALVLVAPAGAAPDGKVLVCHGTASDTNPYVLVSVSENALAGHFGEDPPGHGKNNYPDYVAREGERCDVPGGGEGWPEE